MRLKTELRTTEPLHVGGEAVRITAVEAIPFAVPYRVALCFGQR
jgi:hypothetical protein